jgi:hypothetical protein
MTGRRKEPEWPWIVAGVCTAAVAGVVALAWGRRRFVLTAWERQALAGGNVGDGEGVALEPDVPPIGSGHPSEHCVMLLGAGEEHDAPHCVMNPLADKRFAPIDRGATASTIPSSSTWPVVSKHAARLEVSYWTADGVRGYSGRAFATSRRDKDGKRKHAGVDLFGRGGDLVVACESGKVIAILPFNAGTWAVYIRAGHRVVNLGEVEPQSWRDYKVKPGDTVVEGQKLARVGTQDGGSTMLHVETYDFGTMSDDDVVAAIKASKLRWRAEDPPPVWLRDPSGYLVQTAARTYRREAST